MRPREHMLAFGFTEQSLDIFPIGAEIGGNTIGTSTHKTNLDVKGASDVFSFAQLIRPRATGDPEVGSHQRSSATAC